MDYTALKAELGKPEYNALDDSAIAAAINAKMATVKRPIPFDRIAKDFIATGVYARAVMFAEDSGNDKALRALCITVRAAIDNNVFSDLDPDDAVQGPQIAAILDGLQAAGCLDDATRALILSRAEVERPAYEQFGGERLDWVIVKEARDHG